MKVKSLQKQLMAAIAMVLVAAIALSSATYAWFVNNAKVTATGAQVQAATAYSLLISNDKTNFGTTTKFNTEIASLVPVSTSGTLEDTVRTQISDTDKTATEKFDLLFATSNEWNENHVTSFTEVGKNSIVTDKQTYYYTDTIYLKPGQDGSIYLDSTGLGVAWAAWDATTHAVATETELYSFSKFYGLEDATDTGATTDDQKKALDAYNKSLNQAQALLATLRVGFVVTYPDATNSDAETHVGTYIYQLTDSNLDGKANSTAVSSTDYSDGADGVKGAVSIAASNHEITVSTTNLQSTTNITNADTTNGIPVISGIAGEASTLATAASTDVAIVTKATANTVYTVDTYIWMEGCDVDTVAGTLSQFGSGRIEGIQFGFCLGEVPATTASAN
jgi:hypothetical protein